jgi:membrane protein DedA with SNARE-associated domain
VYIWYSQVNMRYPWLQAFSLIGIGIYVPVLIIFGVLGGRWLDSKFKTENTWTIIGLALGIIVAVFCAYSMLKPFIDSTKKSDTNNKKNKDNQ